MPSRNQNAATRDNSHNNNTLTYNEQLAYDDRAPASDFEATRRKQIREKERIMDPVGAELIHRIKTLQCYVANCLQTAANIAKQSPNVKSTGLIAVQFNQSRIEEYERLYEAHKRGEPVTLELDPSFGGTVVCKNEAARKQEQEQISQPEAQQKKISEYHQTEAASRPPVNSNNYQSDQADYSSYTKWGLVASTCLLAFGLYKKYQQIKTKQVSVPVVAEEVSNTFLNILKLKK